MKFVIKSKIATVTAIAVGATFFAGELHASLVINPQRLEFEGRERSAELRVRNGGTETQTYRLSFIQVRMDETGRLQVTENLSEVQPANDYLRFSPRQITLEPSQIQTVRVRTRKPADLDSGEYRSHLLFQAVPDEDDDALAFETEDAEGVSIRLTPVYGISIPVILRHGEITATTSLTELAWQKPDDSRPVSLSLNLERGGERSVFGDFTVTKKVQGKEIVVGKLNGIAVYPPLQKRPVTIPLLELASTELGEGTLTVSFTDAESDTDVVLSQTTVSPPPAAE